jgi:hypothetical protein
MSLRVIELNRKYTQKACLHSFFYDLWNHFTLNAQSFDTWRYISFYNTFYGLQVHVLEIKSLIFLVAMLYLLKNTCLKLAEFNSKSQSSFVFFPLKSIFRLTQQYVVCLILCYS